MFLTVDIGNTNITFGLFNNNKLEYTERIISAKDYSCDFFVQFFENKFTSLNIERCIISSVVDELNDSIESALNKVFKINSIFVTSNIIKDMQFKYPEPQKIGADRIVNAYAAKKMYSVPVVVVDMGSATTFDIVDKDGNFVGGLIMPGIGMQLKTLYEKTSKLPNIKLEKILIPENTINNETEKAILSGVIIGHARAIEGLLEDCSQELGTVPFIIGTGGYADLVSKCMKKINFDSVNSNLTLEGLNLIAKNVYVQEQLV